MKTQSRYGLILLLLVLPTVALAQLDTNWLRRYDGGDQDEDVFSDMYVDSEGNSYVCGTIYGGTSIWDIAVRKYGPNGESLWVAVWDGPAHNDDSAAALAVDGSGNVYVCGWTTDSTLTTVFVTLKYSASGFLLWAKQFKRGTGDNAATALCLDRAGHVVTTGYCGDTILGNTDYCTVSYNVSNGDTVWARLYNRTPENDEDVSTSICADDSNNVYVTGFSYDEGTDYDFATMRYTSAGVRTWLKRFNNRPWVGDDYGTKVVFSPVAWALYVVGTVYDDNQNYNYITMKLRPSNGDSLWARVYNRYPANDDDIVVSAGADRLGNIYVTGTSWDATTGEDMTTASYAVSSTPRWVARYDEELNDDSGTDVAVDSLGNLYVVGYVTTAAWDMDIALFKYDSLGSLRWRWLWNNPTSNNEDFGGRVALRRDGRIMLGGTSFDNVTDYDWVLMKCREVVHDLGVALLPLPDSLWYTDTLRPGALVSNLSISSDSGWVRMALAPSSYRDSVWLRLQPNGESTVTFRPWIPDTVATIGVRTWLALAIDERRSNDTSRATVVVWDETTAVSGTPGGPVRFGLRVVPNPVGAVGRVRYWIAPGQEAHLRVYDVTGALAGPSDERVRSMSADGSGSVQLDARRLANGVYFVRLSQGRQEVKQKLVVQR